MLLDHIAHKNPQWPRGEILDAALGLRGETYGPLTGLSWRDMHDQLARDGVPGYEVLKRRKASADNRFQAFSDVLEE